VVPNLDSQILFKAVSSRPGIRQAVTPRGNSTSEHPPATNTLPGSQPAPQIAAIQAPRNSQRKSDACQYSQSRKILVKFIFIKKKPNLPERKAFTRKKQFPFIHSVFHLGPWKQKIFPLWFEMIFSLDILGQFFNYHCYI